MNLEATLGADFVSCYDKLNKLKKKKLLVSVAVYCGKNNVANELINILQHVGNDEKSEISHKLATKCFRQKGKNKQELIQILCKEDKNFYELHISQILIRVFREKNTIFLNWLCENCTDINDIFCEALAKEYYSVDNIVWLHSQSKFIDIASGNDMIIYMLKNGAHNCTLNMDKLFWTLSQEVIELDNDLLRQYLELISETKMILVGDEIAVLNLIYNQGKIDIRMNDDLFTNCCELIFMKKIEDFNGNLRIVRWFKSRSPVYKCTIEKPDDYDRMLTNYSIED
jgi:hypothetical protein